MIKALAKRLPGRKPRLRRTTLVNVRYDLGLGLLAYQRAHQGWDTPGSRAQALYKKLEGQVRTATRRLIDETEIIEDYHAPGDLRRAD